MENENEVIQTENLENQTLNEQTAESQKVENANIAKSVAKRPFGWKKVLAAVCCVLLVGIILSISLLSFLPKDYNFNFSTPDLIKIYVGEKTSSTYGQTFSKETEEYQKIYDLYNNSLKTKLITALFQGKINEGVTAEEGYKSIGSVGTPRLEFCYNEIQTLYLNGKEYNANIISDESYYIIVIEVKNSTTLTEVNAYFKYKTTSTGNYSYVRFASYAVQNELYDYLKNI